MVNLSPEELKRAFEEVSHEDFGERLRATTFVWPFSFRARPEGKGGSLRDRSQHEGTSHPADLTSD